MNELQYLTDSGRGNACFWFPFDGFFWIFEKTGPSKLVLHDVDPVDETVDESKYHVNLTLEELPDAVRKAIVTSPYRLQSRVTTAEEAMSHG